MQTPEDPPRITRRSLLLALPALLLAGCAKAPSGGITSPTSGPQLLISMTVAGSINAAYYYFVLFNVNMTPNANNSGATGPVPVVAPPFVNGFAAGAFTNYVEYNQSVPGGTGFGFYTIDPALRQSNYIGSSGYLVSSLVSGNTLSFQLPLGFLATSAVTADQIQTLQINFITTNVTPVTTNGGSANVNKYFDSLYTPDQSASNFVNVIVRTAAGGQVMQVNYTNTSIEAAGDVAQVVNGVPVIVSGVQSDGAGGTVTIADLDITDFTIRLNLQ